MRRIAGDLDHLFVVIVGDQRLVRIQPLERFNRFDRVRVNDAIPDEILPLFRRKMLDLFVNVQELGHAGDVETGSGIVERLHDRGVVVSLDRIVDLHARQVLSELLVVFPKHLMVHDDERRAVFLGQLKQSFLWLPLPRRCVVRLAARSSQMPSPSVIRKFLNCHGSDSVDLRLVVSAEGVGVVLQRVPIRGHGNELAQVGLADAQHIFMRQVVRHAQPPARVLDHPHAGGDNGDGHLHRGGVLVRHQAARLFDFEIGSAPPRLVRVPHHQRAQNIVSAGDFVGHDADARLQPVVVATQFVERGDGGVARTIRVVDRGAVDRLAVFPNGELLGDGERLTVAHDHADDVVIRRHPASLRRC